MNASSLSTTTDPLRAWGNKSKIPFFALLTAMFLLALYNVYVACPLDPEFGYVSKYWADFWLVAYDDGIYRRALIGQIVRWTGAEQLPVVTLNLIAFAILITCLFRILQHTVGKERRDIWFTFFLLCGPTATVLFEVMGDPLQVSFLLFLLFSWLARLLPPVSLLLCAFSIGALMMLVHEASSFLFLPALYLVYCFATGRTASFVLLFIISCLPGGLWSLFIGGQQTGVSHFRLETLSGQLVGADRLLLPSFSALLKEEIQLNFGSPLQVVLFLFRIFRVLFWPALTLILLRLLYDDRRTFWVFLALLAASSPLYIIAHDWGRFSIYSLLIAIVITRAHISPATNMESGVWRLSARVGELASSLWPFNPLILIAVAPLLYYSHIFYRIVGLHGINGVVMVVLVVILLGIRLRSIFIPTQRC